MKGKTKLPLVFAVLATGQLTGFAPIVTSAEAASIAPGAQGVLQEKSAYPFDETVALLKADIHAKGIRFFDQIDQMQLGQSADLPIPRSTLLLFGNPPLGVQFLQSNPLAGLDWPVRMLVTENEKGEVLISWTDFHHIANRYQLKDRDPQIKMANEVAASIAAAAQKKPIR